MTSHLDNWRFEIAWDSGFSTAEGSRTWTTITSDVIADEDVAITYGRTDTQPAADPNTLTLTLKNKTGKYTPGNTGSTYYPNVKKGRPIRVSYREPGTSGNLLSANQASMETSIADWSAGGSVPPALASSTTHADNGTKSLRITWGTGGTFPQAGTTATGLTVGRTYTAQARVWVTAGTPDVFLVIPGGVATGLATSTKGAFATISVTFTATASSHGIQVWPATAPTSGQQLWVDSVMLDEGSSVGTFTTAAPPIYTRFTGYVNEWPVVWPDGSDQASQVTITAASRRARLGQTAPLTSAIRAAYLESSPNAYWPMDEDADIVDRAGRQSFRDITNTYTPGFRETQPIGSFYTTAGAPVVRDGSAGPTDEQSLVRLPSFTDAGLIGTYPHYVGAGTAISLDPSVGVTIECAARLNASINDVVLVTLMQLRSPSLTQAMVYSITSFGTGAELMLRDTDYSMIEDVTQTTTNDDFIAMADGEIHHYALVLAVGGQSCKVFFDGVLMDTISLTGSNALTSRLVNIVLGSDTFNGTLWVGHAAVYARALTDAEILAHADAATAASETDAERVTRVAGRVGVPSAEVDAEVSISMPLGPQPEAGRSAVEVIDEAAASVGGIVYDKRDGHLAMQARNTRYNTTAAFTLSTSGHEVEADLTVVMDDRYLVNKVEYTRSGSDATAVVVTNDTSINAYGEYGTTLAMVSSSDWGASSAADNILYRYAEPKPRISQVSVDVGDLSLSQRALVLAADIGTKFNVSGLPAQAPASSMALFLEGYTETVNATGHVMTINTTPGDIYENVAILDDAAHDVLDSGITLAY